MIVFDIQTIKTNALKTILESVKNNINEGSFIFSKDGIKLSEINPRKTQLVHLNLQAKNFERYEYKAKEPVTILGINIPEMFKLFKTSVNEDCVSIIYDDYQKDVLSLVFRNASKNLIKRFSMNLLKLDIISYSIDDIFYSTEFTMSSVEINRTCKEIHSLDGSTIKIEYIGNQITFSCDDLPSPCHYTFQGSNDTLKFSQTEEIPINLTLPLDILSSSTKVTGLNLYVKLCLKNNAPLIIEYECSDLGFLRYLLNPNP